MLFLSEEFKVMKDLAHALVDGKEKNFSKKYIFTEERNACSIYIYKQTWLFKIPFLTVII